MLRFKKFSLYSNTTKDQLKNENKNQKNAKKNRK